MRYGANANASPAANAARDSMWDWARPLPHSHSSASARAARADSGNERRNAVLYAASGLPVSTWIGTDSGSSPTSTSESARACRIGKNIGASHHDVVNGTARVLH